MNTTMIVTVSSQTSLRPKILVVDDENQICKLLKELLEDDFVVEIANDGQEAIEKVGAFSPDLILMDLSMPRLDGLRACQLIREKSETSHIPILFLTAFNTPNFRIQAFDLGADDFISKPFEVDELISRLLNKHRRTQKLRQMPAIPVTQLGNLILDLGSRKVRIGEQVIELTPLEFNLLKLLLSRPGQVFSRKEILKQVWQDTRRRNRIIDVQVTLLRKKLAGFSGEIRCLYGQGYLIEEK